MKDWTGSLILVLRILLLKRFVSRSLPYFQETLYSNANSAPL